MLTIPYVHGAPNWLDLGTPDLDGALGFYGALFGWTFRSAGPEAGGYGMFQLDGGTVAGGMTVTADQGAPSWTVYFRSDDADATAAAASEHGGSAEFAPMDVMEQGRMALLRDAEGVRFGIWQPGTNKGLDLVDVPGSLCWTELYTPDVASAKAFYGGVFGWHTSDIPFGGGTYTTVGPAGADESGTFGGLLPVDADPAETAAGPYWTPYIEVTDTDAVAARVQELGGEVRMPPTDLPDVGRIAKVADPYGARFAVIRSAARQD
ncbi:VOC family protein [Streptomyces uncialis]|uniref:Hydroxylase n=1 Tax=Streptomyces uncialis TaxID=1048205 RepID=A0A1Q4VFI9_9ACTN|nr:VOC family protein [Streptomyces uncialis]OKH96579.1 hydroxylase [Streptomyces uncialis]